MFSNASKKSVKKSSENTIYGKVSSNTPQAPSGSASNRRPSESEVGIMSDGAVKKPIKKTPEDFIFGKVIGEGSYSTVYLAKELSSGKEFAIKVLEKKHIMRERKGDYVMREKEVLMKLNHPFFIRLYYTFQDEERLYFVLSYAKRGELLDYLIKLSSFDENCSQFYIAEIVVALEYLHDLGIIHRDLKPENVLLNDDMHILITDFGSAKIIKPETEERPKPKSEESQGRDGGYPRRRHSFVGTAQYVSPEMLTNKKTCSSSDLWALGCIVYQLMSGLPPFRGDHEYHIFQKIIKLEYEFPDGFHKVARDLVENLLVLEPEKRLGCPERGGYGPLKSHPFFKPVNWDTLAEQRAPDLLPYLPATSSNPENIWSSYRPGLDDKRIGEIITHTVITEEERRNRLEKQARENEYHRFVENHLILKQGLVDKRKGLFARRRMFLLTEGPHIYYVDPVNKVLKGQIPWSRDLKPEAKNFRIFFVHTPNRTYYLEDPKSHSQEWVAEIEAVWHQYYGLKK